MTGHRTVVIRRATLRRAQPAPVMIREIVLWQRTDVLYELATTTYAETDPSSATINDYAAGSTRADAIATFEKAVSDARQEGFAG